MHFVSGYRCLACEAEIDSRELHYTCPRCGGGLELVFDLKALGVQGLCNSGAPDLSRYHRACGVALDYVPGMPVRTQPLHDLSGKLPSLGATSALIKNDTGLPSASFKDRASYVALAKALEWGHRRLVAASTGNAGASMACLCAAAGVEATIFAPASAPKAKLAQMIAFGADLRAVDGSYDLAYERSLEETRDTGSFNRNTGFNPWTREGKKTVAFEIYEDLLASTGSRAGACPDWVVVPTGDGNILTGAWKGFRDLYGMGLIERLPRLLMAQAAGSDAILQGLERRQADPSLAYGKALQPVQADTVADSISVDLPRDGLAAMRAVEDSGGQGVRVSDAAILTAVKTLARHSGIFLEPAAAAAFAGLELAVERGLIAEAEVVVVLGTGSGLKDPSRVT
jgi:threonine synthase